MSLIRPCRRAQGAANWQGINRMYPLLQKLKGELMKQGIGGLLKLGSQKPEEPGDQHQLQQQTQESEGLGKRLQQQQQHQW